MREPLRILVPVDFTEQGEPALRYAAAVGSALGAEVHLLYHFERAEPSERPLLVDFAATPAARQMARALSTLERSGVPCVLGCLGPGPIHAAVVSLVTDDGYDAVIVGVHGRDRPTVLVTGRDAEALTSLVPCAARTIVVQTSRAAAPMEPAVAWVAARSIAAYTASLEGAHP